MSDADSAFMLGQIAVIMIMPNWARAIYAVGMLCFQLTLRSHGAP